MTVLRTSPAILALLVLVMTLGAVILGAGSARAQSTDPATTAAARSLFERGAAAADAGDHATAADLLRRSLALRPSPVVAFNLAQALTELGHLVEASELLVQVEREATNDALRTAAEALRAQVAPRLAHVTVLVAPADTDATVQLDGAELPAALRGTPTPVDPGPHVALALREGEEVARAEVTVAEAESGELALVVPAPAPVEIVPEIVEPEIIAPPIVTPGETDQGGDDTVLIVVLVSVGVVAVAGLAVGLGVGLGSQGASTVGGNLSPGVLRFGP